jgi:hypothetical protein
MGVVLYQKGPNKFKLQMNHVGGLHLQAGKHRVQRVHATHLADGVRGVTMTRLHRTDEVIRHIIPTHMTKRPGWIVQDVSALQRRRDDQMPNMMMNGMVDLNDVSAMHDATSGSGSGSG